MVGNDVVDLQKARLESNWKHPRFLDKIFTASEKEIIINSSNSFQSIWRLWSMKESAYKVYVQQHHKTFLNPNKIECSCLDLIKGKVIIEGNIYKTTSKISESYIYTTALSLINSSFYSCCFETLTEDQGIEIRYKLLKAFAEVYELNFKELAIKNNILGIPEFFYKGVLKKHSISITHHGRFAGVAF